MSEAATQTAGEATVQLRERLRALIRAELHAFTAETGLPVSAMRVSILDVSTYSDRVRQYEVGLVDITIEP